MQITTVAVGVAGVQTITVAVGVAGVQITTVAVLMLQVCTSLLWLYWCCRCADHYCGCVGVSGVQIIAVAVLVLQVCRSHRGPRVQTLTATRPNGRHPNCPLRRCPNSDLSTKRFVHKAAVVLSLEKGA